MKIQHLIAPTAPLCEQAQAFLVQSSSTRACFLCYLWEVSIMHIHEHPLHLHSPRNPLPTPKDGAEIRNQGKLGSLKWTQHCSINWQQKKIARQSENLNNRNIKKCFEWKPANLWEVWDVPGDNSSASLSWLCTISWKSPCGLATHVCFLSNLLFVLLGAFHQRCVRFALTSTRLGEVGGRRFVLPCEYIEHPTRIMVIFIIILQPCLRLKSGMSGAEPDKQNTHKSPISSVPLKLLQTLMH